MVHISSVEQEILLVVCYTMTGYVRVNHYSFFVLCMLPNLLRHVFVEFCDFFLGAINKFCDIICWNVHHRDCGLCVYEVVLCPFQIFQVLVDLPQLVVLFIGVDDRILCSELSNRWIVSILLGDLLVKVIELFLELISILLIHPCHQLIFLIFGISIFLNECFSLLHEFILSLHDLIELFSLLFFGQEMFFFYLCQFE